MRQIHKYNGQIANEPNNVEGINYQLVYDSDGNPIISSSVDIEIGVGKGGDAYNIAKSYIDNGQITQGLPYIVDIEHEGSVTNLFDGYINLWGGFVNEKLKLIEARAERVGGLDWLTLQGDAVTFEYLYENGNITDADFVDIPYVINRVGRNSETFLAIVTAYVIQLQLRAAIKSITNIIADTSNPLTSANGIIKLVSEIIYLTFLFLSLANLVLEIISLLINPVKYHKGMKVLTMIEKMCAYYGLTFSSSILQSSPFNNMVILPEKYAIFQSEARRFLGRTTKLEGNDRGYYRGTFKELLESLRTLFYAKIRVVDNILYFEPDNFRLGSPRFAIPDFDFGAQRYSYNAEDFYANFILEFFTDMDDRNTILEYKGTAVQVITTPETIPNQMRNLAGRINRVQIPYALAKRKNKLNFIEQTISNLFDAIRFVINTIINAINELIKIVNSILRLFRTIVRTLQALGINVKVNIPSIPPIPKFTGLQSIQDRKNYMMLETDFVDVPKIMILNEDGKLASVNEQILNARYLYENYHIFRSFVRGNNQWKSYELPEIQITYDQWLTLRENDFGFTSDNKEVQFLEVNFNPYKRTIEGKYRVRDTYISGLTENIIEPE
jgi:hypothetical protein